MNEKPTLNTILSPKLLDLYNIQNSVVVVIDVFRATSTIATALFNGAEKIVPVDSVEKCIALGKSTKNSITAGERDGKIIEGLQYGNSPSEYPREFIENKALVLTTTNGTKLLHMALNSGASDVVTGAFNNLSAVCDFLLSQNKNVILGCSAWKDRFNLEDTLFAGAVIAKVRQHFTIHCDASLMAFQMHHIHQNDMLHFIRQTTHWHRLAKHGLEKDMEYCMATDVANVLPIYKNGALYI
jgi:2-phosphosulfolactate phosphatase